MMMISLFLLPMLISIGTTAGVTADSPADAGPANAPLPEYQAELLEMAMDAASKMPHDPHIKDRSRYQAYVVQACLELDQPARARRYIRRIDNWRRGQAAAEYAMYLARTGQTETIDHYLQIAEDQARRAGQDWRRAHVELRMARARMLMGEANAATEFNRELTDATYRGKTASTAARMSDGPSYELLSARLDKLIATDQYDLIRNATSAYVELYREHYQDKDRREAIERKLREAHRQMGGAEVLNLLMNLARAALANDDPETALRFVSEAEKMADKANWPAHREYESAFRAKLAMLRHRADDTETARKYVDAALADLNERMDQIQTFRRADALIPLAEAYHAMGFRKDALKIYEKAINNSQMNPNGRPRAIDSCELCVSMALHGVEPRATVRARIRAVYEDLSPPW